MAEDHNALADRLVFSDEDVRALYEADVRATMKAAHISGEPYFVRNAAAPHQYLRHDLQAEWRSFLRGFRTAAQALRAQDTLFDAIAHGDAQHRAWLKEAIADHFDGRPVKPAVASVQGSGVDREAVARIVDYAVWHGGVQTAVDQILALLTRAQAPMQAEFLVYGTCHHAYMACDPCPVCAQAPDTEGGEG